jgi:hypothetical protein
MAPQCGFIAAMPMTERRDCQPLLLRRVSRPRASPLTAKRSCSGLTVPKNSDPKSTFSFLFPKKFQAPEAWLNAAWNSERYVKKRHCLLLSGYSGSLICARMELNSGGGVLRPNHRHRGAQLAVMLRRHRPQILSKNQKRPDVTSIGPSATT